MPLAQSFLSFDYFQKTLKEVKIKFRKFQNPADLESRLERMLRILRDLEQGMCYVELASDDGEAIDSQLNSCTVRIFTLIL